MITMIAAVGKNREIGKGNDLIWNLKDDKKFFRSTTSGHTIIMGRKTFESLNGLLPNRHHVVLTTNKEYAPDGVEVVHSVDEVLEKYGKGDEECFIIGGGEIYKLFLPYAQKMYLTEIDDECVDAEVFFPEFDKNSYDVKTVAEIECGGISAVIKEYRK